MKKLILISGKARSGKNTFADFLSNEFKKHNLTVEQDLYANGVKNGSKEDFRPLSNFLNNYVERIKAQVGMLFSLDKITPQAPLGAIFGLLDQLKIEDHNWYEDKTPITRLILQAYGTEIFRKRVDTDWWAKQLKERFLKSNSDIFLVTDVRFPNEIEVFNDAINYEVITIRVDRSVDIDPTVASHDSETALDNWSEWTYLVDNNTTLESLKESVNVVLKDILIPNDVSEKLFILA